MQKETSNQGFQAPRHWIGPEELSPGYWADQATREKRGQEFFEKPIEAIDFIDRTDKAGLARRDFLTIMGASMAMAGFACARRPVNKIIPYVVKPEELTPGVALWYASTDPETGDGLLIRSREGRPVKLEGNPSHPGNRGRISARTQAQLLNLYDPDRLKGPVALGKGSGGRREANWAEADEAIVAKLKGAKRVRVLSDRIHGDSTRRLVREFLQGFQSGELVEFSSFSTDVADEVAEAQGLSYGTAGVPQYRFDQADVIVSLGADFLGTWISPVEFARDWVGKRKLDGVNASQATLSKFYCFESHFTITGAKADERYPVRPGDELKIAMAIANELSSRGAAVGAAPSVSGYKIETVAQEIGIDPAVLKKVADDLWKARGRSLVVGGSLHARTADSLQLQLAINLLNSALGNDGATVLAPEGERRPGLAPVLKLIDEMKSGQVDVLVVHGSNPAFQLPASLGVEDAIKKVPFVVALSDREDETAVLADWALPVSHFLESWGDYTNHRGVISIQQPAITPIHSTRAFEDSLLAWVKAAGASAGLASRIAGAESDNTWHDYLRANWRETVFGRHGGGGSFDKFWEDTLREGVVAGTAKPSARGGARALRGASVAQLPKYAPAGEGIRLALYEKVALGDGRHANNAWLQEVPDPISSITWDNYLNVSPALAAKHGLNQDDVCEVSMGDVKVELPVRVQPGIHPSVVTAAVGYGRRRAGKVGTGAGVDVSSFIQVKDGRAAVSGQVVSLRKTGRFYKLAATQWHFATENRPVINDVTLEEFKKNPKAAVHTDPHLRLDTVPTMWPVHEYKGYRWGMAIDLNSCIGCQACVIGCQSENNVPVVGRDQVRVSRQMHWLRIDRYYTGAVENPDVVFQPMLCQHCENAPCETVCPVLATVHDDEGTSNQVYNRCVGTRYCSNNCPYKVRRFNFFDHWKAYEGTMNMAWNPEVTVRTRGIMEKCSFCIQRIRDGKDKAKDEGRKVKDLEIQTACMQTCPTDAIVFGNINDPESRVSKLRADQRAFRVLEVLNTRPVISYMTKVRNKPAAAHGHGGEHHG